ncbi:MAG: glycosyltransferase family 4 protein [Cyanobacteria bacterium CRU_2_1]|nr:glycosyltransferase family 4 protein [Cyanobacteria bacterium CRU_2_1]
MIWIGRDTVFRQLDSSMSDYLAQHYPKIWHQQIQCLGALSAVETRQYQRGAGFILVPSTWDVFNYACVEGMAYGRAVLCSDGAGAADLIETGVNGIRFKPNDPQALATALEHWMGLSVAQRSQMGQAAQDTVRTVLNPSVIAQTRAAAYAKLIHQGRSHVKLNDWMKAAIAPHQPMSNPLAFLDYLPLKNLAQYVVNRGLKKLKP